MKRRTIWIVFYIVVVSCLLLAGVGMYHVPLWLQSNDLASKSDAIVVLAGGPLRAFYAADLYKKGYANVIYVSKPTPETWETSVAELGISIVSSEEIYRQVLVKKGVPKKRILFFGRSLSTVQEAENIRQVFTGSDCKILVVTSPYHVRRTKMIFAETIPSCKISVVGTPYEPFPERWWTDQDATRNVLLELAKIVYYRTGGRFRST